MYLIVDLIAQGGQGAVYRAIRMADSTAWALKEMGESMVPPDELQATIDAFYQEGAILQTLTHPNLVKVTDIFQDNNRHYMVMQLVDGETLLGMLAANHSLPLDDVLRWGGQLCDVLDYLHTQPTPIIYRDLKPENIMVDRKSGDAILIDFGIARRFDEGKKGDTRLLGTVGYAAPEQYSGKRQSGPAADIYALGATLHHLLSNEDPALRKPFDFPSVSDYNPAVRRELAVALAKAVNVTPERRYVSAATMYEALLGKTLPRRVDNVAAHDLVTKLPDKIDFGTVDFGRNLTYDITPRINQSTQIRIKGWWLKAMPEKIEPTTKTVTLQLDTKKLTLQRDKAAGSYPLLLFPLWPLLWLLFIHARQMVPKATQFTNNVTIGQSNIKINALVSPTPAQRQSGWLKASSLVTIEIGLLILTIGPSFGWF